METWGLCKGINTYDKGTQEALLDIDSLGVHVERKHSVNFSYNILYD